MVAKVVSEGLPREGGTGSRDGKPPGLFKIGASDCLS